MRVLLIEDDKSMAQNIKMILTKEGMVVDVSNYGEEGTEYSRLYEFDIIILDLGLPDMDGLDVLKKIRLEKISTPVLILSGTNTSDKKVQGLVSGADDYLTKPFDKSELVARIKAIVRRSQGHSKSILNVGKLEINLDSKTVCVDGDIVHLTGKEFQILMLLAKNRGRVFSKEQIYDMVQSQPQKHYVFSRCGVSAK